MQNFTRILIVVCTTIFVIVVFLASSQGWWHATFRDSSVMKQNQQYNQAYQRYYGTYQGSGGSHLINRSRTNRSFRSGSRSGRGK